MGNLFQDNFQGAMKIIFLRIIRIQLGLLLLLFFSILKGQTFGKIYKSGEGFQLLDGIQTSDGGFALAGLQQEAGVYYLGIAKLDCQGKYVWGKKFPGTGSANNIGISVIERRDHSLVLIGNLGVLFDYDILVARFALDGTLIWSKLLGGNGDDNGNGVTETTDGGLAVCGYTSSYGTDAGSNYADQYVVKLDSNGAVLWSRTIGNSVAIDRGNKIIETPDLGLAISGSYLTNGTFYASITKLDNLGNLLWLKSFGLPNHGTHAYCISNATNGDILIGGSTTILKASYMDYPDNLLIRTNSNGDSSWVKVYNGTSADNFENASSVMEDVSGNIHLMVATASYPSTGFVPNKQMVITTDPFGQIMEAKTFNRGGSHYPQLHKAISDGYVITGFTNWTGYLLNGNTFSGNVFKTDTNLSFGCSEYDFTVQTIETRPGISVETPPFTEMAGSFISNGPSTLTFTLTDTTLCENFPLMNALFSKDTSSSCIPAQFVLTNQSTGPYNRIIWEFEDTTIVFNLNLPNQSYAPQNPGVHYITIYAIDTLCKDTVSYLDSVLVYPEVEAAFNWTPTGKIYAMEPVFFQDQSTGNIVSWNWGFAPNDSSSMQNPIHPFATAGQYNVSLEVTSADGCKDIAFNLVEIIDDTLIPTIFSPNADGTNDVLFIDGFKEYTLTVVDRWGVIMFENQKNLTRFWDGKNLLGQECQAGVYYVVFEGTNYKNETFKCAQPLTLVR